MCRFRHMTLTRQFVRTCLFAALLAARASAQAVDAQPETPPASKLRDPVDGKFDLSAFIDQAYGFVPLVIPITEPAVGYGAGGGLVFIDKPKNQNGGFARPNISAVGGMATENGTWGAFAGDSRHWRNGRLQTLVGAGTASINLDFYGFGDDAALRAQPLRYTLSPLGGMVSTKLRLGQSRFFGGLGYTLAETGVKFSLPGAPGVPAYTSESRTASLTPSLSYDTRDNIFTPTRGLYAEANAGLFSEALGGDQNCQKAGLIFIGYFPLAPKWTLGVKGEVALSFGEVPFYLRPAVRLRGVPAMSYQGDDMAQAEAEVRWQFSGRYSVVVFGGAGAVWSGSGSTSRQKTVVTGGTGFRYLIARKYGLHMGVDVAFGPADPALYIQFGSAWLRP